jgi:uncharacterized protein (TIGR02598 family)
MAIAVIAVAFVALLGLLPAGMSAYRSAAATSAATQIFEKVLADARQTDFSKLVYPGVGQPAKPVSAANTFREPHLRYFDQDGEEVVPKSAGAPSADEVAKIVYHANTRIVTNSKVPEGHLGLYLATLTVQIATNPGNLPLSFDGDQLFVPTPGIQIRTFSVQLAKND